MTVTRRKKLAEYATKEQVERFVESLEKIAEFAEPEFHLKVADDSKDDIVINTAIDGEADFIVSGDHHLLHLREFRGIMIPSVDEAVRRLKRGDNRTIFQSPDSTDASRTHRSYPTIDRSKPLILRETSIASTSLFQAP